MSLQESTQNGKKHNIVGSNKQQQQYAPFPFFYTTLLLLTSEHLGHLKVDAKAYPLFIYIYKKII